MSTGEHALESKEARQAKEIRRAESMEEPTTSVNVSGKSAPVSLKHPVVRGKVDLSDDTMEKLLEHTFSVELDMYSESLAVPVLVSEAPGTDKATRARLTQMLFEQFKVSGVCFANSAVLSLFASGRTRGVVLEVGAGVSSVVPVFEGYSLPHAVLSMDCAGQDVTSFLKQNINHELSHQAVQAIKHKVANANKMDGKGKQSEKSEYEVSSKSGTSTPFSLLSLSLTPLQLPDGTTINIDGVYASACVDQLFNPDEYGIEAVDGGLGDMLAKSMSMCDKDLQVRQGREQRRPPSPDLTPIFSCAAGPAPKHCAQRRHDHDQGLLGEGQERGQGGGGRAHQRGARQHRHRARLQQPAPDRRVDRGQHSCQLGHVR
jgi:hypothetical protein